MAQLKKLLLVLNWLLNFQMIMSLYKQKSNCLKKKLNLKNENSNLKGDKIQLKGIENLSKFENRHC